MPPKNLAGKRLRQTRARAFIACMEACGYAPIPYRGWTRRFRAEGVRVKHGPISITHTGNWAPKLYVESLIANRRHAGFRKIPFHLQVKAVVLDVMMEELLTQAP
ncbi:hypothetical protein [Cystobacter fuscus]|uniref:hypothetical protein n=1 Tax=Cystobacter fuscus TaxID=43 RepID=UPI002B2B4602|nr:hypothetical protein F0U63_08275 [Cystobacter fuscus]